MTGWFIHAWDYINVRTSVLGWFISFNSRDQCINLHPEIAFCMLLDNRKPKGIIFFVTVIKRFAVWNQVICSSWCSLSLSPPFLPGVYLCVKRWIWFHFPFPFSFLFVQLDLSSLALALSHNCNTWFHPMNLWLPPLPHWPSFTQNVLNLYWIQLHVICFPFRLFSLSFVRQ